MNFFNIEEKEKLIAIVGPTASGKTTLAEHLAGVFSGELVNADSRQVYKRMNIGTAKIIRTCPSDRTFLTSSVKPTTNDLRPTTHLVDIAEPNEQFTVAEYKKLAIKSINDIQGRKKLPILVGGTGLYIKAIVENLEFPRVPAQKELRAELEKESTEELYRRIEAIDPKTAKTIDRFNRRRLVRALEVILTTKKSFSEEKAQGSKMYDALQIAIDTPKEILFQNIEKRVQEMIFNGLEGEVRLLLKRYGWTNTLRASIGYKEWKGYFEGEKSREDLVKEIIRNTKYLAKKQLTWFKHREGIRWVKNIQEACLLVKQFLAS